IRSVSPSGPRKRWYPAGTSGGMRPVTSNVSPVSNSTTPGPRSASSPRCTNRGPSPAGSPIASVSARIVSSGTTCSIPKASKKVRSMAVMGPVAAPTPAAADEGSSLSGRLSPAMLEDHRAERRDHDVDAVGAAVVRHRKRPGLHPAEIALAASPVDAGVRVEHLVPAARMGHPHPVGVAGLPREVDSHLQGVAAGELGQVCEHAVDVVVGVDPLEAGWIGVELVERRLLPVETVEVGHQPLDPRVGVGVEEMPVEVGVVVPLG